MFLQSFHVTTGDQVRFFHVSPLSHAKHFLGEGAFAVFFPDLPGCLSSSDVMEGINAEALRICGSAQVLGR